jgi:hypothetical protein
MATAKAPTEPTTEEIAPIPQEPVPTAPAGRTATPANYGVGSIKHDPAELSVAVRTTAVDPDRGMDWGVMTVDRGGHYAGYDEVQTWEDVKVIP